MKVKQDWSNGNTVKVGFMSLVVVGKFAGPGDWLPDAYLLKSAKGVFYEFIPHNGLSKLEPRLDGSLKGQVVYLVNKVA